jgi:GGDEF domain-containing protein
MMHATNHAMDHGTFGAFQHEALDRKVFFDLLCAAIDVAEAGSAPVLLIIDVPGLLAIGQRHGSGAQAALARLVAQRLCGVAGAQGFIGQQSAARFTVLLANDGQRSAEVIGDALLACLALPIACNGLVLPVGAAMGCANWADHGKTAEELFVAADQALHRAVGASPAIAPLRFRPSPLARSA